MIYLKSKLQADLEKLKLIFLDNIGNIFLRFESQIKQAITKCFFENGHAMPLILESIYIQMKRRHCKDRMSSLSSWTKAALIGQPYWSGGNVFLIGLF